MSEDDSKPIKTRPSEPPPDYETASTIQRHDEIIETHSRRLGIPDTDSSRTEKRPTPDKNTKTEKPPTPPDNSEKE